MGSFWSKLLEAGIMMGTGGGLGGGGASPVQSLQPLEGRSATHIQLSACPVPLRPSQSSFFFRSEVIWSSLPANSQILWPLLKLSCPKPPMF